MSDFTSAALTKDQHKNAAKACYDYTISLKPYAETFLKDDNEMYDKVFDFVRTQRMVVNYLLAVNYVNNIDEFRSINKINHTNIEKFKCIDRLYGHDVCFFIREAVNVKKMDTALEEFTRKHVGNLSFKGMSTLAYLIGRTHLSSSKKNELLDRIKHTLDRKKAKLEEEVFYKAVASRSIRLSNLKTNSQMKEYIHTLIGNDFERNVNRMFYLQFYGDRMEANGEKQKNELITYGFDFFRTYHILASRLLKLKEAIVWNDMHKLELFTLCDLVQIRIDTPDCLTQDRDGNYVQAPSFFYDEKYNTPNDLAKQRLKDEVLPIIRQYLMLFRNSDDHLFIGYLEMCEASFESTLEVLKEGPLTKEKTAFVPNNILKTICALSKVKRVGWNINESSTPDKKISKDEIIRLQEYHNVHETTLEHTFEAFSIGLFYLPDSSKNDEHYDKQKILNMLLIHDLGEISVGDILPSFADYKDRRERENKFCRTLFVQSIHNNIGNLNELFTLWDEWSDKKMTSYNARVAKDIDRIQRLFKMLVFLAQPEKEIGFTVSRVKEFWESIDAIHTEEGKRLYKILILDDPVFVQILKQYDLA